MTNERMQAVNASLAEMTRRGYQVRVSGSLVSIQDKDGREWTKYPVEWVDELCQNILNEAMHRARIKAHQDGLKRSLATSVTYTERAAWPGLLLSRSEWQWFDCQDGGTQRDYYKWATRETKVEA